ncbi:hypothetical protein RXV86_14090 [Alisedimentitalea sp. MJ-SS2]|uniref:hypothetical protein n=1 Tax=Aliisedimentitalea sp. MJ-SS2 TaxID=3049795 RepID=UPI00290B4EA1|nr:hypothetical protein [Alisedimentitalea sp. MJ-SS2]MDU8928517.1 hypothetical protein [Alisedimentitalea sp. MJ-SS2]
MKKFATVAAATMLAGPALAHHDLTPLREAMMDGHSHAVGGATYWLAGAVIAMVLALFAVQKSVFRKR